MVMHARSSQCRGDKTTMRREWKDQDKIRGHSRGICTGFGGHSRGICGAFADSGGICGRGANLGNQMCAHNQDIGVC